MKNHRTVEITPGMPRFNQMVFRLTEPLDDKVLQSLDYESHNLTQIQKGIFVMPVYIEKNFNLFMVVGKLVANDWVVVFSQATIKDHNKVTDLSTPFPTGRGLNLLGEHNPKSANRLLKYFQTLVDAKFGEWRLVKVNKKDS